MKKNKLYVLGMLAGLLAFSMTVVGCTTTSPVSVTEPARLNMSGVTRIAVLPFDTSDSSSLQGQASAAIPSFLERQLNNTGRFELVSSSGIAQLKDRSSVAEAVIVGRFI
jgi:hypothetical protein